MLEQQQQQLVTGLQELYELVIKNQGWKGAPLKESTNGHPLTHDILERLGALKFDSHVQHDRFEEDLDMLRQKLVMDTTGSQRKLADLNYQNPSPFSESISPKHYFKDPCPTLNQFPPTPPIQSPHQQAHASIRYISSQNHVLSEASLDPSMLQSQRQTWIQQQPAIYDENLDYLRFDPASNFDTMEVMQDATSPCLPISPWLDDDLSPFELSTNMAWIYPTSRSTNFIKKCWGIKWRENGFVI